MRIYKKGTMAIVIALVLAGCGSDEPGWMEAAWEHDVDQKRWMDSSTEMKVATAGLWLQRLQENDMLTLDKPVADMEPEARELASCIDSSMVGSIGQGADRVSRYSALCVQRLGFNG